MYAGEDSRSVGASKSAGRGAGGAMAPEGTAAGKWRYVEEGQVCRVDLRDLC